MVFTKKQVAQFYEIDVRTLEKYLEVYGDEFKSNGYDILKSNRFKDFIKKYNEKVTDINVGELASSITSLAIFDFRAFLNVEMLLVESEKTGGATKYINQRDENLLNSWFDEENYRRKFTDALIIYLAMEKIKYMRVFLEKKQFKQC